MGPIQLLHWCKSAGRPTKSRLSRYRSWARRIVKRSEELQSFGDTDLLKHAYEVRWQAKTGVPLHHLLPESFALVREAARRTVGMQHFPVQVMGGISLFEGHVAEMQTGEGKTLTAVLPAFLRALPGRGVHIVTVNDYLARRDAETMGPIYEFLGLSVGCIQTEMQTDERREAYAKDITYGTAKEIGFDFLRDRLRLGASGEDHSQQTSFSSRHVRGEQPVQRGQHFALVDEADSVLIDEARTPLIIGLTQPNDAASVNLFRWSHRAVHHLEPQTDFIYEPDRRTAYLTDTGCRRVLLMAKPSLLDSVDTEKIYTQVEKALTARYGFQRDRDYVVVEDKVHIVDESTGRIMEGRKWQDGLHQAVEAKELVPITASTEQAARITVQNFFRQYTYLSGMTGTGVQARRELKKVYGLQVTPIPTHRPCIRKGHRTRVFADMQSKRHAIVEDIERIVQAGRAVLVGTPSVEASEGLGELLKERGIAHRILNARYHEQEADIVARAGEPGKVTIATNMAGRGTDIRLDEAVRQAGGLHVIATEVHSSRRIDRQLVGRAARLGDPGSYQMFLSLEDELLRCLKSEKVEKWRGQAFPNDRGEISSSWLRRFYQTQRLLERTFYKQRKDLLRREKYHAETYRKMGLDPFLEVAE